MLDIKFVRENPDIVKENIKKKFQDHKIPMVDEVIKLDEEARKVQQEAGNAGYKHRRRVCRPGLYILACTFREDKKDHRIPRRHDGSLERRQESRRT